MLACVNLHKPTWRTQTDTIITIILSLSCFILFYLRDLGARPRSLCVLFLLFLDLPPDPWAWLTVETWDYTWILCWVGGRWTLELWPMSGVQEIVDICQWRTDNENINCTHKIRVPGQILPDRGSSEVLVCNGFVFFYCLIQLQISIHKWSVHFSPIILKVF